jgi:hypothetical protein
MSLVGPILEYGLSCWDSYRDGQRNRAAKLAHHRNYSNWDTLTQSRTMARICALFKAYTGEPSLDYITCL